MEDKIRLLYVEDEPAWASIIESVLTPRGFLVEVATNGEEAVEMFRKEPPDMVLLDIEIPGRNGWELICDFKLEKESVPVIFYSSYYHSSLLPEAFGVGAEDFISKTTLPEELSDRLHAFYVRALHRREQGERFKLSDTAVFDAGSGMLTLQSGKVFLKLNEARLLYLLCRRIGREADKRYLCEGIWGKGMYCDVKCQALKILVTNLRKILAGEPGIRIINKRWGGYYLIRS